MYLKFDTDVQFIKGVGPRMADILAKKNIKTVKDLLFYLPRTYQDLSYSKKISDLNEGDLVSVKAKVFSTNKIRMGRTHKYFYTLKIYDESGAIECKYFRLPFRGYFDQFERDQDVIVSGKVSLYRNKLELSHPEVKHLKQSLDSTSSLEKKNEVLPVYTEIDTLNSKKIAKLIKFLIDYFDSREGKENIPEDFFKSHSLLKNYNLPHLYESLKNIHFPDNDLKLKVHSVDQYNEGKTEYHKRLIFEEFFFLELLLAMRRIFFKKEKGLSINTADSDLNILLDKLPFKLTTDQLKTIKEVATDISSSQPMYRLVQGDVGSGKTLVSFCAAYYAIADGFQAALMAPTEILAEQHFTKAKEIFEPLGIKVDLLTGSLKASEKEACIEKLKTHEIHLVIGTHALIEDTVFFNRLGLVIIDEQHRFGVQQRKKLKSKGYFPHFLVMTATPIPRTLSMTLYGDLDVSIIKEKPPGRQTIVTRKTFESKREKVYEFINDQLKLGRQAYIIYPLVEESEKLDLKNATSQFEILKNEFPDFQLGLLHGKMKQSEKEAAMNKFRENETQILVATTVVEVGVDVANANLILIEHTERFGLSQLHQLRGRVGRGKHKSYCILMLGQQTSEESIHRASVLEKYDDGFIVSEEDLKIRGPGEFLGTKQSGLPHFFVADLLRDQEILAEAKKAAFSIIDTDPTLSNQENIIIKDQFDSYQEKIEISKIG